MSIRITYKIAEKLVKSIGSLSDNWLERLIAECKDLNQTNCWWVEYDMREIVLEIAQNEKQLRKEAMELSDKESK